MNQKHIAVALILTGIIILVFIIATKQKDDFYIDTIIATQDGSCYLEDGTCLHSDRNFTPYIIGYVLSSALIILGIYLLFFDRTHEIMMKQNKEVSTALKESKKMEKQKSEFEAFLSAFNDEEKKVISAVKEQEGIQQSTLRLRVGMSKTSLSLLLKNLEQRNIISKVEDKKTNRIYLRKKF